MTEYEEEVEKMSFEESINTLEALALLAVSSKILAICTNPSFLALEA